MSKICPRYARDMRKICPRYAQDMPKICTRYAREICKKKLGQNVLGQNVHYFYASWGKMSLGHFVLGHFVLWGKMSWGKMSPSQLLLLSVPSLYHVSYTNAKENKILLLGGEIQPSTGVELPGEETMMLLLSRATFRQNYGIFLRWSDVQSSTCNFFRLSHSPRPRVRDSRWL